MKKFERKGIVSKKGWCHILWFYLINSSPLSNDISSCFFWKLRKSVPREPPKWSEYQQFSTNTTENSLNSSHSEALVSAASSIHSSEGKSIILPRSPACCFSHPWIGDLTQWFAQSCTQYVFQCKFLCYMLSFKKASIFILQTSMPFLICAKVVEAC